MYTYTHTRRYSPNKMKLSGAGTGFVILVWSIIFLLLGAVLYLGYRRNVASLELLMQSEAQTLMSVVTVSSAASIHALDEVEYLNAVRLLNNARFIALISEKAVPSPAVLREFAFQNDLHLIHILDRNGRTLSVAPTEEDPSDSLQQEFPTEVTQVLSGEKVEAIIGFGEGSYYSGKRYAVAVRRRSGGAVVVNMDSNRMLGFRKAVGLGTIFQEIGSRPGVQYIVLQDTLGIVAASLGIHEMGRINDDPFLLGANNGRPGSRFVETAQGKILEVVKSLVVDDVNLGLVRIGLSTAAVDAIKGHALRQVLLLFFAVMLSGAFLIVSLFLRQNYLILHAEHDRILREVRQMEEEASRSERLASMGRLAAGVAHEIRNPLNAISIIVQRLKAEFTPMENQHEFTGLLSTVRKEIARISAIIEDFLIFARPPRLACLDVKIESVVTDVLNIVGEKARLQGITMVADIPHGLICRCDPDQVKQAILNITLNALEAIGANGSINIYARKEAKFLVLEIKDSGPGIPEQIMPNIFDPFYSTKEEGTGLGLNEVHRIITSHRGRVTAANSPSGGAVFSIYLPSTGETP